MLKLQGRLIATGLGFPEGPVALPDGSVLVVEIAAGRLTRVLPNGELKVIAQVGGGPEWRGLGSRWALLYLQQRRLQLAHG